MRETNRVGVLKLERCTKSENVYRGRILNLRVDEVDLGDGRSTVREVVEHRGAAAIVPMLQDKVVLVRQFRYAAGSELLEIPAGTLERGEHPEACASRELEEETGYKCNEMQKILECFMAPGYSSEMIHFYLARNLELSKMKTEEDERIRTDVIPISAAIEKIRKGEIHDAKTVCGLYRALEFL
jgi:nudix-type nucleoside diphosphatase (YffH/AdpP family)